MQGLFLGNFFLHPVFSFCIS